MKYTEHGTISVEAKLVFGKRLRLHVSVADTGIGIRAEDQVLHVLLAVPTWFSRLRSCTDDSSCCVTPGQDL